MSIRQNIIDGHVWLRCADCGMPIGRDDGPPDGWQLEDGRTVCHACCLEDTRRICDAMIALNKRMKGKHEGGDVMDDIGRASERLVCDESTTQKG